MKKVSNFSGIVCNDKWWRWWWLWLWWWSSSTWAFEMKVGMVNADRGFETETLNFWLLVNVLNAAVIKTGGGDPF